MSECKITNHMIQSIRSELGCSLMEALMIARQRMREVTVNELEQRIRNLSTVTTVEPDRTFEIQEILQDMLNLIK